MFVLNTFIELKIPCLGNVVTDSEPTVVLQHQLIIKQSYIYVPIGEPDLEIPQQRISSQVIVG